MKKIHYIGLFIDENDSETYYGYVPGVLKMRYVKRMLERSGSKFEILSLANRKRSGFYKKRKQDNITFTAGYEGKSRISRFINKTIKKLQFITYILFKVSKDDVIILYHNRTYTKTISSIRHFVKRRVILEVEEIYGYSPVEDRVWVKKEIKLINNMDAFILVNEGMTNTLNIGLKPYVVSYGNVDIPNRSVDRYQDKKVHIIYAGTIENKKRGAITAALASEYLDQNFFLHILGFGEQAAIDELIKETKKINQRKGYEVVKYEGYYSGKQLDEFMFRCHIGLSSNVMRPNFANHSFPSKVITYMCHDLSIVLGYADAFAHSKIGKKWTFYYDFTPKDIAEAIRKAPVYNEREYEQELSSLDNDFLSFIKTISDEEWL